MNEIVRRQPRGIPVGGQFAEHQRAGSGLALDDAVDPWLDINPADDPWAQDDDADDAHAVDPELAELIAMADRVNAAVTSPGPISRDEGEEGLARWDAYREVNDELKAQYGSVELAATAVGARIADRGQAHAEITAEQVAGAYERRLEAAQLDYDQARAERDRLRALANEKFGDPNQMVVGIHDIADPQEKEAARQAYGRALGAHREYTKEATAAGWEAEDHLRNVRNGSDKQTMADLRRLSDGYLQALAEVRQMGGTQMQWHSRTAKAAREAFDEAATIFPTDWIEASNDRIAASTSRGGAPLAKISRRRAHYMDRQHHRTRKRGVDRYLHLGARGEADMTLYGRSSSPYEEWSEPTAQEQQEHAARFAMADGTPHWRTSYTVANPYDHGGFDDDTPPRGRGWERWVSPKDPEHVAWRRPKTRMQTVSVESAPEITTNAGATHVQGRSPTFAVSAHEMSHRFEYSVAGIIRLEEDFLTRRTTDPVTGEQQKARPLWRGSREYARADDFIAAYTGKDYGDSEAFEVLSTGVDAIFGGRRGALAGTSGQRADADHRNFTLGVMACVGRKRT
ncbi:hypothetical protein [Pseudactinotalea sp. Z1748]|uniref:hypothetical protein n=1 Tax=Pseudactinotalea sp. Z1748 TaxID=3413027 RepID=UPI003C7BEABE